jgi:phosphoribosyl 1,2-cyclic phosphodiesterase
VPPEVFRSAVEYRDFRAGETLSPAPEIRLRTGPLNHPDGSTGYRIEYEGRVLCYITDTEHVPGNLDRNVLGLMSGADLVIYDCMYTDDEYPRYTGWGHSTWQEGLRLCRESGAKRLAVFHHDPDHDDDMLDGIGREVERRLPGSVIAREGLVLEP